MGIGKGCSGSSAGATLSVFRLIANTGCASRTIKPHTSLDSKSMILANKARKLASFQLCMAGKIASFLVRLNLMRWIIKALTRKLAS